MVSTIEKLSEKEKELLASLFGGQSYAALKKLLETERVNTATKLLDVAADDVVSIARHQGRADFAKQLHITLKKNHQRMSKEG